MPKPNVILIVMDTARCDHFGCYGYSRNTTPNVDAISKESIQFMRAYSSAPWTPPAHASLFTGMYNSKHGVYHGHVFLENTYSTLAEILSIEDYKTISFSNNPWVSEITQLTRGFEESVEKWENQKSVKQAAILKLKTLSSEKVYDFLKKEADSGMRDKGTYSTNILIQNWLEETKNDKRPFFIFINYMETHLKYNPPKPYDRRFIEEKYSNARISEVNQDMRKQWSGAIKMTGEDFYILTGLYDGELNYLDWRMGQLFQYLREKNILDNTILIILSDHGENLGDHGLMDHQLCVYDTLIRISLIIRYPSKLGTGIVANKLASITDIFPTILGLLDIKFSFADELQGINLFSGEKREYVFSEYESPLPEMNENRKYYPPDFDPKIFDRNLKVVRNLRHKFIHSSDSKHELYDILNDPEELRNIRNQEEQLVQKFIKTLDDWLSSFHQANVKMDYASLSGLVKERLSALGYF